MAGIRDKQVVQASRGTLQGRRKEEARETYV